jgi:DNA-binding NarL/FixJ family response regulator
VHGSSGALERWLSHPDASLKVTQGMLSARGDLNALLCAAVGRALDGEAAPLQLTPNFGPTIMVSPAGSTSCFVQQRLVNVILMPSCDADPCALRALPPALRPVARLMAQGAADKEIASMLGMTLPSARTYAARVLKRAGVQSRRELMLRIRSS